MAYMNNFSLSELFNFPEAWSRMFVKSSEAEKQITIAYLMFSI
jgi:hypothetical protein